MPVGQLVTQLVEELKKNFPDEHERQLFAFASLQVKHERLQVLHKLSEVEIKYC